MLAKRTVKAKTVDVAFCLPADVRADAVAPCARFNESYPEAVQLQREDDGTWLATVTLELGHAHRYRDLLDGERWEKAWGGRVARPRPSRQRRLRGRRMTQACRSTGTG